MWERSLGGNTANLSGTGVAKKGQRRVAYHLDLGRSLVHEMDYSPILPYGPGIPLVRVPPGPDPESVQRGAAGKAEPHRKGVPLGAIARGGGIRLEPRGMRQSQIFSLRKGEQISETQVWCAT